MNPELGQAWFRVAVFITLVSAVLILFEPRDSAEFVVSFFTFVIGLVFVGIVVILTQREH